MFNALILASSLAVPALQSAPSAHTHPAQSNPAPLAGVETISSQHPGRLGVTLQDTSGGRGVLVGTVEGGSPAESAGIQVGDRIREVDGNGVSHTADLVERIRAAGADKSIALVVERELEVTVENLPSDKGESRPRLGVRLSGDGGDLRAESVEKDSPAEKAGVHAGDRLLALDGHETPDGTSLSSLVGATKAGQKVTLRIGRELHATLAAANDDRTAPHADAAPTNPGQDSFIPARPATPRSVNPPRAQRFANPPAAPRANTLRQGNDDMHAALADLRRELESLRRDINDLKREIQSLRRERSESQR